MDPWQPCSVNKNSGDSTSGVTTTIPSDVVDLVQSEVGSTAGDTSQDRNSVEENKSVCVEEGELSFADNFQPFVKLPDSQEYLESLERKLKIIQKGGRKGPNADSILRSLGQTKESCMIKLLSNSVEKLTVEGELFEELKVNPILKKLAPEKQALSAEELVHLLKADQLEILLSNNNIESGEEPTEDLVTSAPISGEATNGEAESTATDTNTDFIPQSSAETS